MSVGVLTGQAVEKQLQPEHTLSLVRVTVGLETSWAKENRGDVAKCGENRMVVEKH